MADIDFEVISADEYSTRTRGRGRGGGRRSKYTAIGQQAQNLKKGQVVALKGTKNQVVSVRNYFKRNYNEDFTVRSVAAGEDAYDIYIHRADAE
jgi:hypothetical protein